MRSGRRWSASRSPHLDVVEFADEELEIAALVEVVVDDEGAVVGFFRVDLVVASSWKGFCFRISPKVTVLGIGREDALGPRSTVRKPS